MGNTIEKVVNLEYNPLFTLGVIENDLDLSEILFSEIKLPFSVLYKLESEGMLSDSLKELLVDIFEGIILTKTSLVEKYLKLANESGVEINEVVVLELPQVDEGVNEGVNEVDEGVNEGVNEVDEGVNEVEVIVKDKVSEKKEPLIPRRYGKEKITKDIEAQGGVASPVQRAMLKVNDLKNIYVNLSARGIKDMIGDTDSLSDEDCRKIVSAITTFERQMGDIVKTKAKKK